MKSHIEKKQEQKDELAVNTNSSKQITRKPTFHFIDNRPEAFAQRKLQEMANNSPQVKQPAHLQAMANIHSVQQQQQPIQKKAFLEQSHKENKTGLPDNLKLGIEYFSGYSMDDVKVHRNSDKPAQLQAHAYAQGTDIHLASGQEKHLPHEAWHVVQQKQGRVKPTMQMKGKVNINNDSGLEREADVMGEKAVHKKEVTHTLLVGGSPLNSNTIQRKSEQEEKSNAEISEIINSLKAFQGSENLKSDTKILEELAKYIEKATHVLKGDDVQAKRVLIENAKNGNSSSNEGEKTDASDLSFQMKAINPIPLQRSAALLGVAIVGGVAVAAGIGFGIYRLIRYCRPREHRYQALDIELGGVNDQGALAAWDGATIVGYKSIDLKYWNTLKANGGLVGTWGGGVLGEGFYTTTGENRELATHFYEVIGDGRKVTLEIGYKGGLDQLMGHQITAPAQYNQEMDVNYDYIEIPNGVLGQICFKKTGPNKLGPGNFRFRLYND